MGSDQSRRVQCGRCLLLRPPRLSESLCFRVLRVTVWSTCLRRQPTGPRLRSFLLLLPQRPSAPGPPRCRTRFVFGFSASPSGLPPSAASLLARAFGGSCSSSPNGLFARALPAVWKNHLYRNVTTVGWSHGAAVFPRRVAVKTKSPEPEAKVSGAQAEAENT